MTRPRPSTAAYNRLAGDLRVAILKGQYRIGDQLPTETELVRAYGVSRQTVRRGLQDLVSEGMVQRFAGRGTFVAPQEGKYLRQFGSIDDLMALSVDTCLEVIAPLRHHVDFNAAGRLGLATDVVHTIVFRRRHGTTAVCVTTVHLPPEVARLLHDVTALHKTHATTEATVIGLLDSRLRSPIIEADQSITACPAPADIAAHLGCNVGTPILRIDRLYRTTTNELVELAVSYFLPEHYSYRVKLRRSGP